MYKVSVPIMNSNLKRNNREETLKQQKRFNAKRVFWALDCYELDENKSSKDSW